MIQALAQKQKHTTQTFNLQMVHPSWRPCLEAALQELDPAYLKTLAESTHWLPGQQNLFNAFSLPVSQVNYVLFGESPYPRAQSANGYAFWDAAVGSLWSETGLSKPVNRATSLRHIIKMLLVAEGLLDPNDTTQPAIAKLDKKHLVTTNTEFFTNLLQHGFLLLNATLVLSKDGVRNDARAWRPFLEKVLHFLLRERPQVALILFGKIANDIDAVIQAYPVKKLYAEHPYNITFVKNQAVIDFFRPLHLLRHI